MKQTQSEMRSFSVDHVSHHKLSQQYGGIHTSGWVNRLPHSWIPYIQLSRLSPPAGLFLIYFPHVFGVAHAATIHKHPLHEVFYTCLLLLGGSFFCNNASHAWNDLVDASIDKMIPRTRNRPIPRGCITPKAAFVFTVTQALGAAAFLLALPAATSRVAVLTIVGTIYYPYAKRHTHLAQVVLGFCLSWGVIIGSSAMGVVAPWTDASTLCLCLASVLWVVIFDTIYAHQDLPDDVKVGVKSMAVKFKNDAKPLLWTLLAWMGILLCYSGYCGGMGPSYYLISVVGCLVSVGLMISRVKLRDPSNCWAWFASGFWLTGASMALGLLVDYTHT